MKTHMIIIAVKNELEKAKAKHPTFPKDAIHAVAIVNEEAGEAIQAALNFTYEDGLIDKVRSELIQTAATCFRCLENIDDLEINKR